MVLLQTSRAVPLASGFPSPHEKPSASSCILAFGALFNVNVFFSGHLSFHQPSLHDRHDRPPRRRLVSVRDCHQLPTPHPNLTFSTLDGKDEDGIIARRYRTRPLRVYDSSLSSWRIEDFEPSNTTILNLRHQTTFTLSATWPFVSRGGNTTKVDPVLASSIQCGSRAISVNYRLHALPSIRLALEAFWDSSGSPMYVRAGLGNRH